MIIFKYWLDLVKKICCKEKKEDNKMAEWRQNQKHLIQSTNVYLIG